MKRSFRKRVFSRVLAAVAMTTLVLGAFSAARVLAKAVPPNLLDGDWKNVDPHTREIDVIVIAGKKVHPFGVCHPKDCDWGVLPLKASRVASSGNPTYTSKLVVKHPTVVYLYDRMARITYPDDQVVTSEIVKITISLLPDGRLRVDTFTRFPEAGGRADQRAVNYFRRSQSPTAPATH